jgi:hypothetical protein
MPINKKKYQKEINELAKKIIHNESYKIDNKANYNKWINLINKAPVGVTIPKINGTQMDLFAVPTKKTKTKRSTNYQTGTTNIERDKKKQALAPGKRKSKTGRTYYEYRANRSDKGVLLGTKDKWSNYVKYKNFIITKLFPSGMYEIYDNKIGKFIKFDSLTEAKNYINNINKKINGNHKDTKSHNVNIRVVSGIKKLNGLFDTSIINDIDSLKKEYFKLAKKYHPDAGGTTAQFQNLQSEYEVLLNKLLAGSKLTEDQKANELIIDEAIRAVIDQLIGLEGINIELIGKWLWISGNTYPVKEQIKKAGLMPIKKQGKFYWVYKGVESSGRGKLTMEEIKARYGSQKVDIKELKKISGVKIKSKSKLLIALKKLIKAINNRPI